MKFSLGEVLVEPLDIISRNIDFLILPVVPAIFNALIEGLNYHVGSIVMFIGRLIAFVISLIVSGALVYMANEELEGRSIRYTEAINYTLEVFPDLLVASIIIALGTLIGLALFVIPGLVWLFLVVFTIQEIVLQRKNAVSAIQSSIELVKENAFDLLAYFIVLLIVMIVIAVPLALIPIVGYFIASIFLEPYTSISLTMVYRALVRNSQSAEVF
ncbi:hypothetical protein [Thermococcus sp.]|uniref:DUF7847 domain-containing protein n=1 Tax=Thermococcus sp. TaxID=35749 RepID=UPI002635AF99|nr:hypothetical protein [Thermococcus sp.]